MSSTLQLISFLVSFLYGIFNFYLIKDLKLYLKHILTFIYVIDMTIIYIIIFYHLNKGYFHIYFILMVFVGFFIGYLIYKNFLSKINVKRIFRHWKLFIDMLILKKNRNI